MNIDEKLNFEGMHIKDEYESLTEIKELNGGKNLLIKFPYSYTMNLKLYDLLPGIRLIEDETDLIERYTNQDHIFTYDNPEDILVINYIVTGQCQIPVGKDKYMFVKKGDFNIYLKRNNPHAFNFLGDSQFIHIFINKKQFKENVPEFATEYITMIDELYELVEIYPNLVFHANDNIKEVLNQIKHFKSTDKVSKQTYTKLKVLEIITLMYADKIRDEKYEQHAYTDAQIRVVRKIKNALSRDIASYISLDVLSASYSINLTTLKNCFRDMYGKPLYTWYREYKFQRAKDLIKNTNYPISKIANMIGYKSSSKFSKAFKKEMGVLPSSYRKKKKEK